MKRNRIRVHQTLGGMRKLARFIAGFDGEHGKKSVDIALVFDQFGKLPSQLDVRIPREGRKRQSVAVLADYLAQVDHSLPNGERLRRARSLLRADLAGARFREVRDRRKASK
jgi:hypothetical protein